MFVAFQAMTSSSVHEISGHIEASLLSPSPHGKLYMLHHSCTHIAFSETTDIKEKEKNLMP
jgi:hypothetical protein